MQSVYRLRKTWEFAKTIEKSKKVVNSGFVIFCSPSQLNNCRYGISIPRKLVKKAVQRNHYKRQIKNILLKYKDVCQNLSSSHYNLVIIVRPGFLAIDQFFAKQKSLVELLDSIFQREPELDRSVSKRVFYA